MWKWIEGPSIKDKVSNNEKSKSLSSVSQIPESGEAIAKSHQQIADLKNDIKIMQQRDFPAFNPEFAVESLAMAWMSLVLAVAAPTEWWLSLPAAYLSGTAAIWLWTLQIAYIAWMFYEKGLIKKQSAHPETFNKLVADLWTLSKATLDRFWLWDKLFWLDKWIEANAQRWIVHLDFDWSGEWYLYKDEQGGYSIIYIWKSEYSATNPEQTSRLIDARKPVYCISGKDLTRVLEWVHDIRKNNKII